MQKIKIKKSFIKRFFKKPNGKFKRSSSFKNHKLYKKSNVIKNNLYKTRFLSFSDFSIFKKFF